MHVLTINAFNSEDKILDLESFKIDILQLEFRYA